MSIQEINSAPEYITKFISGNLEQLEKIYNEGMEISEQLDKGILYFNCSEKENVMDVQFMDDIMMESIIAKDSVGELKQTIRLDKKLLFVNDIDRKCVFLIQI
tara:strand:+ start:139 stop:447 length:309 start_codon:yes stop_codon:yes gene_type:complete